MADNHLTAGSGDRGLWLAVRKIDAAIKCNQLLMMLVIPPLRLTSTIAELSGHLILPMPMSMPSVMTEILMEMLRLSRPALLWFNGQASPLVDLMERMKSMESCQ